MKTHPHAFTAKLGHRRQPLPWPFCIKCGLLLLRNEKTEKAARKPCPGTQE